MRQMWLVVVGMVLIAACSSSPVEKSPIAAAQSSTDQTTSSVKSSATTDGTTVSSTTGTSISGIASTSPTAVIATTTPAAAAESSTTSSTLGSPLGTVESFLAGSIATDVAEEISQTCAMPDPDCVRAEVHRRGLPEAVSDNFPVLNGQFLTAVLVGAPTFALVTLVDPWMANSNETYAVVGGDPSAQFVNDRLATVAAVLPPSFDDVRSGIADLGADAYRAAFVASASVGTETRLTFVVPLIDGCRSCAIGVGALITMSFDTAGRESAHSTDGPCAMDPVQAPQLPQCPTAVGDMS